MAHSRRKDEKMSSAGQDLTLLSRIIFSYIQEDKLCKLQAVMKPYTKCQRQIIVSNTINGCAPLFLACHEGNVHFITYLIEECNADIDQKGTVQFEDNSLQEMTPLYFAVAEDKLDVVKTLVWHGAKINKSSDTWETPVLNACYNKYISIVKFLVEHGANIHKPNVNGETCLMYTVENVDLCSFLIDNGVNVNVQDKLNNTALHHAIKERRIDTVRLLLRNKSNYSLKNNSGDDALQSAALRGCSDIVETILEMSQQTVTDAIKAYELLGVNFVDVQNDMVAAVQIWKKAMALRYLRKSAPLLKQLPERRSVYLHLKEPETMEELNNLTDPDEIRMNSLLITERILGPTHWFTTRTLIRRGGAYADSGMYLRCVDLWKYAYKLKNPASEPFNENCKGIIALLVFFFWKKHVDDETVTVYMSNILDVLNILSEQIINGHTCLKMDFDNLQKVRDYSYLQMLLQLFLHLIHLISQLENFDEHKHIYMNIINTILVEDPRGINGERLLHLAVDPNISLVGGVFYSSFPSLNVIKILVECGANVDALQNNGNSPLCDCARFLKLYNHQEQANILDYLVSKGAHVDICNYDGESALTITEGMAFPFLTNHVSLQCLASRVILKHNIPYNKLLPKFLSHFVGLHGKRGNAEDIVTYSTLKPRLMKR